MSVLRASSTLGLRDAGRATESLAALRGVRRSGTREASGAMGAHEGEHAEEDGEENMTDTEVQRAIDDMPRYLRDVAACLMRWATRLEGPWIVGGNYGHLLGVIIGALRYKAMDLDKLANALEQRTVGKVSP